MLTCSWSGFRNRLGTSRYQNWVESVAHPWRNPQRRHISLSSMGSWAAHESCAGPKYKSWMDRCRRFRSLRVHPTFLFYTMNSSQRLTFLSQLWVHQHPRVVALMGRDVSTSRSKRNGVPPTSCVSLSLSTAKGGKSRANCGLPFSFLSHLCCNAAANRAHCQLYIRISLLTVLFCQHRCVTFYFVGKR